MFCFVHQERAGRPRKCAAPKKKEGKNNVLSCYCSISFSVVTLSLSVAIWVPCRDSWACQAVEKEVGIDCHISSCSNVAVGFIALHAGVPHAAFYPFWLYSVSPYIQRRRMLRAISANPAL